MELISCNGVVTAVEGMKMKDQEQEWGETDELWDLLGKADPSKASGRFTDDTLRAVKLLPEADPWWPRILRFSPVAALAACVMFAAVFLIQESVEQVPSEDTAQITTQEGWDQIAEVADTEIISAAVDHMDEFSDDDLIAMIGF